jgi:hypothetical protein
MIIDKIMVVQKQDMQKHVRIPEITCCTACMPGMAAWGRGAGNYSCVHPYMFKKYVQNNNVCTQKSLNTLPTYAGNGPQW